MDISAALQMDEQATLLPLSEIHEVPNGLGKQILRFGITASFRSHLLDLQDRKIIQISQSSLSNFQWSYLCLFSEEVILETCWQDQKNTAV